MRYCKSRVFKYTGLVSSLLLSGSLWATEASVAAPLPLVSPAVAGEADGPKFVVSQVVLEYASEHPGHPALATALASKVELGEVADGLVAPRQGISTVTVKLSDLNGTVSRIIYASGLKTISQHLVQYFTHAGLMGVYVSPSKADLDLTELQDLRTAGNTTLRFVIHTSVLANLRTLASGDRIPGEERINNPAHRRIVANSPLQPAEEGGAARRDLMRQDSLTDYVNRLNRHPGRRVDVAVSAAAAPGKVALDYLVTEDKPWTAYFQAMNTGTEGTGDFRERFGFVHNQLTGHDDILSLDYMTSGFDQSHAGSISYEIPVIGVDRLRLRPYASYSEYTSADVGSRSESFTGDSWSVGLEAIGNVFRYDKLFIDVVGGARWQHSNVELTEIGGIPLPDQQGEGDFFIPYLGLRLEHNTEIRRTSGALTLEENFGGVADTPQGAELDKMGRANADRDWTIFKWNVEHSFYLEPIVSWKKENPNKSSLAHEIWLSFRGQEVLGDERLPPQFEDVAGGFFTVRGYPESVAAGDNVQILSVEYRLHVPRLFGRAIETRPMPLLGRPFKVATKNAYNSPDWDLIIRPFFDYAHVSSNNALQYEEPQNLMSYGVGLELRILRNFSLRCDWGHTLREVSASDSETIGKGHDRIHLLATLLW